MLVILAFALLTTTMQSNPCDNLLTMSIPDTTITGSDFIPEGSIAQQSGESLPAYCKVTMVLQPSTDSNINVELWLPTENWNGKLLAVGNGGWAGSIQGYADMEAGLQRGYATAATDTGHSAADGSNGMFALGHPEKIVDFAYRAIHDMTVKSKRLIAAFYEPPLQYAYFKGCSTGGRQALMEAQRYPGDFDGIIVGAPAYRHIRSHTAYVANVINLSRNPDQAISQAKALMVSEAVMNKCDTLREGFLNNPIECSFDLSSLLCEGPENDSCLTQAQLQTVETFYNGLRLKSLNKRGAFERVKGELIFTGQSLGNALSALPSTNQEPTGFVWDTVSILGFQDPDLDWHDFLLERDLPIIERAAGFVDAVDPDLRAFKGHGGKLLLYHGWADPGIAPKETIHYYVDVLEEMGSQQDEWLRLFMVPGMGHCGGGNGPHTFDSIGIMEMWREEDIPPGQILGSNPQSGLTRPLCPFPQYAEYDGSGSLADSSNWTCSDP